MERYQVELKSFPGDQLAFIKALRLVGKISLSDATKVYVHASNSKGTVLVAGVDKEVAEHLVAVLAAAQIDVVLKNSSLSSPMICRPQSNVIYKWSRLRGLVTT